MNQLLHYLLESSACLLVFYLLYVLALKREKCFTYNRFYLLLTPLLALIIPLVELPFVRPPEPITTFINQQVAPVKVELPPVTPATNSVAIIYPDTKEPLFRFVDGLWLLYIAGTGFFALRLGRELYRLHRFHRQTKATRFYWQNIPVHKTNGAQPTFSFGNCIYWDNSQPLRETDTEYILRHEAVHVRQKHSWDIVYLEFFKILFWFNPLFYLYQKSLVHTHEFIADAVVLRTTNPEAYSNLLVNQVLHRLDFSFGNYFNKSLILIRLKMLKQNRRRPNKLKQLAALPVFTLLVFALSSGNSPANKITEVPTAAISQVFAANTPDAISKFLPVKNTNLIEPIYPGGKQAMYAFLTKNVKFPREARNSNMAPGLVVALQIDEKGFVNLNEFSDNTNTSAFKQEVNRVLRLLPAKWTPAMQNGKPIAARYLLTFSFLKRNPADILPKSIQEETELSYAGDSERSPVFSGQPIEIVYYDKNIPLTQSNAASNSGKPQNARKAGIGEPKFPGGTDALNEYLKANIVYPELAQKEKKEGNASIVALIDKQGNIKPLLTPANNPFSKTLSDLVAKMPRWEPATQNGQAIESHYLFRFKFVLANASPKTNKSTPTELFRTAGIDEPLYVANEVIVLGNPVLGQTGLYKTKVNDQKTAAINPDEVFTFVEQTPVFPGGLEKMYSFLSQNIKYPEAAKNVNLQGNVIAQFVVTKTGKITDLQIVKGLSPETDAETKRVISLMPDWEPGKQDGKAINVKYTLPIRFDLNQSKPKSQN